MLSDKGKFTYSRSCVTLVSCRADLCSSPVSTEAKTASDKTHTLVKSGSKTILLSFFLWAAFEPFDRNKRQWFIKITYKYGNIRGIKLVSTQLNKNCNSCCLIWISSMCMRVVTHFCQLVVFTKKDNR